MMNALLKKYSLYLLMFLLTFSAVHGQETATASDLDQRVKAFLDKHRNSWRDMNVPASDGQLLYDIILKNNYTKGLEIGTSTGHSTIWMAWAFSKTGGKLVTIEIDPSRYRQALENFEEAGLTEYIDARLANAHELVPALEGPFDMVFSDADKGWYTNYFKAVMPKLEDGGCFAAHNVFPLDSGRRAMAGTREYLQYVQGLPGYTTSVDATGGGMAITYKN